MANIIPIKPPSYDSTSKNVITYLWIVVKLSSIRNYKDNNGKNPSVSGFPI